MTLGASSALNLAASSELRQVVKMDATAHASSHVVLLVLGALAAPWKLAVPWGWAAAVVQLQQALTLIALATLLELSWRGSTPRPQG